MLIAAQAGDVAEREVYERDTRKRYALLKGYMGHASFLDGDEIKQKLEDPEVDGLPCKF